jgi:hypothetical protein
MKEQARRLVLVLTFLVGLSAVAEGQTGPGASSAGGPDMLRYLPQPPSQPASLYAPPVPLAVSEPLVPVAPYFLKDPLLDRPELPPPGWFALVWADVVHPQLVNHLRAEFPAADGTPVTQIVQTAAAPLSWTINPAGAFGYRLPAGFGEVYLLYRGLASSGSGSGDGFQTHSRMDFNVLELNYANSELWPYPGWIFRPLLGLRLVYDYFDTVAAPFDPSVGSPSLLRTTNTNRAIGPHAGTQIGRYLHGTDLAMVAQCDIAALLGATSQGFLRQTLVNTAGDAFTQSYFNGAAAWVPMFNAQAGLSWMPTACPGLSLFAGYTYEAWWSVGQIALSNGAFVMQGIALRGTFQF